MRACVPGEEGWDTVGLAASLTSASLQPGVVTHDENRSASAFLCVPLRSFAFLCASLCVSLCVFLCVSLCVSQSEGFESGVSTGNLCLPAVYQSSSLAV